MKRNPVPTIALVVIVLAVIAAAYLGEKAGKAEPPPPPAASVEPRPEGAPYDAWMTVETFLAAWQSTDPNVREAGFSATAVPDLAGGLMLTAPEHIVTDQRQSITVAGGSAYATAFNITFATRPDVRVEVTADPAGEYDWRVTDITSS